MINAPHDKEFVFHDGTKARNILDLVSKMEGMSDHDFHHFVNHHKNDFANWLEHVFFDKALAEKLRKVNSRPETIQILKDRINDVTIGHSVIQIPKIEGHHKKDETSKDEDRQIKHEHGHLEEKKETGKVKKEELKVHDAGQKEQQHMKGSGKQETDDVYVNEAMKPDNKANKAKQGWFRLFKRKDISEERLEKIGSEEEDKLFVEKSLKEETKDKERENALWITLYFALVLLIITLLIYKLFL